jgi:[acyl-carrier-protein] S-malonyltransferase
MARVAFLFPGQGAQAVGMAAGLCSSRPAARRLFDQAGEILGYDLLAVCSGGPKEKLDSTAVSQPAIYVASLAALKELKETEPDAVRDCSACAGLSLGEYTALTFAGALTFADGLRLVKKRGEAMQAAADARAGGMVSILLLEQAKVEEIVAAASAKGLVRIANYLCPGNLAISGEVEACAEAEKRALAAGAKAVRLAVAGAFHTELMQPAVELLTAELGQVGLAAPRIAVWANVTAAAYTDVNQIKTSLARQVVEPVRWEQTMRGLLDAGFDRFYEIGPGKVLAGLLKRVFRKVDCRNVPA